MDDFLSQRANSTRQLSSPIVSVKAINKSNNKRFCPHAVSQFGKCAQFLLVKNCKATVRQYQFTGSDRLTSFDLIILLCVYTVRLFNQIKNIYLKLFFIFSHIITDVFHQCYCAKAHKIKSMAKHHITFFNWYPHLSI